MAVWVSMCVFGEETGKDEQDVSERLCFCVSKKNEVASVDMCVYSVLGRERECL